MAATANTGIFGRFAYAHGRVFATFPPYRYACFVALPAALLAAIGFALQPAGWTAAKINVANTGDYAACGNAMSSTDATTAQQDLSACQRIQSQTAQGSGSMAPADVLDAEALAFVTLNNVPSAIAALNQALALKPNTEIYLAERANFENQQADFTDAERDATQAASLTPNDAMALEAKAQAENGLEQYQAAVSDATQAINAKIDPANNIYGYRTRGAAEAALNDDTDAIQDENTYLNRFPDDWAALYWRGLAEAHVQGDPSTVAAAQAQALNDLQASVRIAPNNAQGYEQLGLLAFRMQNFQDVVNDETKALSYNQNDVIALTARAGAEIHLQQFQAAQTDAQAAVNQNPAGLQLAAALRNLGVADINLNNKAGALQALNQALQIDPGNAGLTSDLQTAQQLP